MMKGSPGVHTACAAMHALTWAVSHNNKSNNNNNSGNNSAMSALTWR